MASKSARKPRTQYSIEDSAYSGRLLDKYLKHDLLTQEEEGILATRYQSGDISAGHKLVMHNLRFVYRITRQYAFKDESYIHFWDLFHEGCMGALHAVGKFDVSENNKFISYAVWWIKQRINKYCNDCIPMMQLKSVDVAKLKEELCASMDPNDPEYKRIMAAHHGRKFMFYNLIKPVSLDAPGPENDGSLLNTLANPDVDDIDAMQENQRKLLADLLKCLPDRERDIIDRLYGIKSGEPEPLRDVGARHNISHERVRQIRDQALKRIRKNKPQHLTRFDMEFA